MYNADLRCYGLQLIQEMCIMKHVIFGIQYIINHNIFRKNTPLICGITVTNKCNLRCRHYRIARRGIKPISFEEAITAIDSFYD